VRRLALALALLGAGADEARAGGLGELFGPRAVGRAGVGTVSDDGAAAILTSPAALARRAAKRVQLGLSLVDDDLEHRPTRDGAPDARAQGEPWALPIGAGIAGVGPIVVGLGIAVDRAGRTFASPDPGLTLESVEQFFAYRYAGFTAHVERRTAALAAAARVSDWLAVGATASISMVRIEERRRLWAGFTSRLLIPGDPAYDVDVAVSGDDRAVPGAVFGVFVAPSSIPIELAASIAWSNQIHVAGDVDATPQVASNVAIRTTGVPTARLDLPAETTIRAGARWLGDRWTVEAGVDAWLPRDDEAPIWRVDNAAVVDVLTDRSEPLVLASRFAPRRHVAVRAALDVELVAGFLWVTGGYAWRGAGSPGDRIAPTTADLGGHTAALGVEIAAGGFTATVGWSRTFAPARTVTETRIGLDDPFDPVVTTAGLGGYDATRDVVGVSIELADDE
jgi:hypothetical protein